LQFRILEYDFCRILCVCFAHPEIQTTEQNVLFHLRALAR
jgi:hypothetical protein